MISSWCKDKAPRFQQVSFLLYCLALVLLPLQIHLPKIGMETASFLLLIACPLVLIGFGKSFRPNALTFAAGTFLAAQLIANFVNAPGWIALLHLKGFVSLFLLMEMTRIFCRAQGL